MERADVTTIFENAQHPYTQALLSTMDSERANKGRLVEIPGSAPKITADSRGCLFASRCQKADQICFEHHPEVTQVSEGHEAACWRLNA